MFIISLVAANPTIRRDFLKWKAFVIWWPFGSCVEMNDGLSCLSFPLRKNEHRHQWKNGLVDWFSLFYWGNNLSMTELTNYLRCRKNSSVNKIHGICHTASDIFIISLLTFSVSEIKLLTSTLVRFEQNVPILQWSGWLLWYWNKSILKY